MQCAPKANFLYHVVMPLSSCANVPSLVSLAQKFTNSEDPTFKKLYPSGTCRLCRSSPVTTKDQAHLWWLSAHKVSTKCVHWLDLQHRAQFFGKGSRGGTWHVPRGTDWSATGTIVFPPFRHIEWCLTRPDPTSRSGSRCQNVWTDRHTGSLELHFLDPTQQAQ